MVKLQWVILRMVVEGLRLGGAMLVAEMIADSVIQSQDWKSYMGHAEAK